MQVCIRGSSRVFFLPVYCLKSIVTLYKNNFFFVQRFMNFQKCRKWKLCFPRNPEIPENTQEIPEGETFGVFHSFRL
jgi:hypothetical protein